MTKKGGIASADNGLDSVFCNNTTMNKMYTVVNLASNRNNKFQLFYLSDKKRNKSPLISVADLGICPPPSVAGLPPLCV